MQLILFDIDGTLLGGQGVGSYAMERAGRRLFGEGFTLDGIDFGGALDPWIFREALGRLGRTDALDHHDAFHDAYIVELTLALERGERLPRVIDGVAGALAALGAVPSYTLGLVTGNYTRAVPLKLTAAGIDPSQFVVGAFGDEAPTRPDLVRLAMDRWVKRGGGGGAERVVVIGDTPRDIDCAKKNGCRCIAVATGKHTMKELDGLGADHVVPNLDGVAELLHAFAAR
jgi:phosphoglycolate phosphatase-like HAD superfamily hydrolase